jgi:hypothetical protein
LTIYLATQSAINRQSNVNKSKINGELMYLRKPRILALALSVSVAGASVLIAQAPAGKPAGDGLLRSELSLSGRTLAIAFAPDLKAGDPKTSPVLAAAKDRTRIGELETAGAVHIGTLDLGTNAPAAATPAGETPTGPAVMRYELWLESSQNGWLLLVNDSVQSPVGDITLDRRATVTRSPNLSAAVVADSFTSGSLVLRWGAYEASAPLEFINPSRRRTSETPPPNQTINRRHDEDTSALSRARLLAQRNETALTTPKGARVSVSFQRSIAPEPPAARSGRGLAVDRPDFARLETIAAGAIVLLSESPVPRLRTELPLRFGKTSIATGNQVVGFPGSYGLWLKRTSNGWRLVFNHEPDAWGSQHNAQFDAAEIDLAYSAGHAAGRPFAMNLIPEGPDRGRLQILWGPHEWVADFSY